jgi:protein subunit release factor B
MGDANEDEDDGTDIIDFLHLFSDLVALLHDESLREAILNEVESVIERSRGVASSKSNQLGRALPPELDEDDLEEKFVKGSGAGGQKVNKTSNRVILTHLPTQVRVECQDTRSLQQNRKIARKRLRLKVDAILNGEKSLIGQKAKIAVTKKAKYKDRNKRRRQQKENQP